MKVSPSSVTRKIANAGNTSSRASIPNAAKFRHFREAAGLRLWVNRGNPALRSVTFVSGPGRNPSEDGIDPPVVPEIGDGILPLAFAEVNSQRLFSADKCKYSSIERPESSAMANPELRPASKLDTVIA